MARTTDAARMTEARARRLGYILTPQYAPGRTNRQYHWTRQEESGKNVKISPDFGLKINALWWLQSMLEVQHDKEKMS